MKKKQKQNENNICKVVKNASYFFNSLKIVKNKNQCKFLT